MNAAGAPRPRRLRSHLLMLVASLAVPLALAAILALEAGYHGARERAELQLRETTRALARLLDREFAAAEALLRGLAASPELLHGDLARFDAIARRARPPGTTLALLEASGRMLVNTDREGGPEDLRRQPAWRPDSASVWGVAISGQMQVTDVFTGSVSQRPLVAVDIPVPRPDGARPLVLALAMPADLLGRVLRDQHLPEGWVAAVLDRRDRVVARTSRQEELVGKEAVPELRAALIGAEEGVVWAETHDRLPSAIAFSRASGSRFSVAVAATDEALLGPLRSSLQRLALIALALTALALGFAWRLGRRVERGLAEVAAGRAAGRASPGASGIAELERLGSTLAAADARRDAAEAALREERDRARLYFETAGTMLLVLGPDRRVRELNRAGAEMLGAPAESLLGRDWLECCIPPRQRNATAAIFANGRRDPAALVPEAEGLVLRRDGTERLIAWRNVALRDPATGAFAGTLSSGEDVTGHRAGEAARREAEERLRLALAGARLGTWDIDLATGERSWSAGAAAIYGVRDAAALARLGWAPLDHVAPEDRDRVAQARDAALAGTAEFAVEYRLRRPDGTERLVASRGMVVREAGSGRPLRMAGVVRDVTEERQAQRDLAESEARLRSLAEALPGAVWVAAPSGEVEFMNHRWEEMSGQRREDALGHGWLAALAEEDRDAARAAWTTANARGEAYETTYRLRPADAGGALRWVQARGLALRDPATGQVLRWFGTVTDLDEVMRAREGLARQQEELERLVAERTVRLAESEALFRAAFEDAADPMLIFSVPGKNMGEDNAEGDGEGAPVAEAVNPAAERVFGLPAAALLGRRLDSALAPAIAIPLLARLEACIAEGRPRQHEWTLPGTAEAPRVLAETLVPLRDPRTGRIRRVLAVGRDITDQRALEARLVQGEKLEALGRLAGGVAHDFNNVLQAVLGGARLMGRRPEDADGVRRLSGMVAEAAERGAAVARRLLSVARRGELRAETLAAEPMLRGMAEVLAHTLGAGVAVEVTAEADLPLLHVDRGQLETALVNLAVNARDAMPGGGTLTLSAGLAPAPGGAEGGPGWVRIAVADSGQGMDPAVLARAGEPFFTTKPTGAGTGLGLATVRSFAEQSGGTMGIASAPGRGTIVSLLLPPAPPGAAAAIPAPGEEERVPEGTTLLLAEDEPGVRRLLAEALAARGFAVVDAGNGAEALARLEAGPAPALLVTDLAMPGMDGLALIEAVRRRRPGLPALLLTGFAGAGAPQALQAALRGGPFALLRKPAPIEEVTRRAAALLRASGDARAEAAPLSAPAVDVGR